MTRKEMVQQLSQHLGRPAQYQGAPSFAYEIEAKETTYTIHRDGTVTNTEGDIVDLTTLMNQGTREASLEVNFSLEGHTGQSLVNVINMIASKESLLLQAFGLKEPFMEPSVPGELAAHDICSLASFREAMEAVGPQRCPGIIVDFDSNLIRFPMPPSIATGEEKDAFAHLMNRIEENARRIRKALYKPAQQENPKYALRTWLIRLGLNGPVYKETRKVLLKNLEGSSAFRREESHG